MDILQTSLSSIKIALKIIFSMVINRTGQIRTRFRDEKNKPDKEIFSPFSFHGAS